MLCRVQEPTKKPYRRGTGQEIKERTVFKTKRCQKAERTRVEGILLEVGAINSRMEEKRDDREIVW